MVDYNKTIDQLNYLIILSNKSQNSNELTYNNQIDPQKM